MSDGTDRMLIPWGKVSGTVTLPGDAPYEVSPSESVMLARGRAGDAVGGCGGGEMVFGVDRKGRFELPCQVGRRTIFVQVAAAGDGKRRTIGRGTVVVKEGKTARLDIELAERP